MSKGGGATTTPATPAEAPQTNALQHLLDMIDGTKPKKADGTPDVSGTGSYMPVSDPTAWMKMGAGNFMPQSSMPSAQQTAGSAAGKGGGSAGGSAGKGGLMGGG